MTEPGAPSLDTLSRVPTPAWLWDADRLRIVWANKPAITLWRGETLFDLLDRRFAPDDPIVTHISEISRGLMAGGATEAGFPFRANGHQTALRCRFETAELPDGRPGILVQALVADEGPEVETRIWARAAKTLPYPLLVCDRSGRIVAANEAATANIRAVLPATLGALFAEGDADVRALVARALDIGQADAVRTVQTSFGPRVHRLHFRRIDPPVDGSRDSLVEVVLDDVTERRRYEIELEQNIERLSDFLAAAASFTWELDRDLRFSATSEGFLPTTGTAPERVDGEPWQAIAATFDLDPDGGIAKALEERKAWSAVVHWKSGEAARAVSLSAVPVLSPSGEFLGYRGVGAPAAAAEGVAAAGEAGADEARSTEPQPGLSQEEQIAFETIGREVGGAAETAETKAEQVAAQQPAVYSGPTDDELRAILDTASDGIITLDHQGRIESLNASAQAIFGYDSREAAGRAIFDFLTPDSARIVKDYLAALSNRGLASIFNDGREVTAIERRGREVPLFLTIGRIEADPRRGQKYHRFCAVIRDITQWKRTETELRRAKEQAERDSAQKSEFLANISHELRTPLNAIIGFSEVMRTAKFGTVDNEKYRGYINDIHASGQHLLSLINDLLDLSKIEAGKLELNFTSVNIAEVLKQSIDIVQPQATQAGIMIRTSMPEDLPNVVADQRSLRQIFLNILSNAVKFTEAGGQIVVSAFMDDSGEVHVRVKDTGIGMTAEELATAMVPFRRVERPDRQYKPGTGLGLPLTKALVEANRATFGIKSEPDEGTLVTITFPTPRVLAD